MILEPWPGGRWFRDRGNGVGHLWGHVQVIKPPVLIELSGPMFMSYPALNHVELRLDQIAGGTIEALLQELDQLARMWPLPQRIATAQAKHTPAWKS